MRARTGQVREKDPLVPVPKPRDALDDALDEALDLIGGRSDDRVPNAVAIGCAP